MDLLVYKTDIENYLKNYVTNSIKNKSFNYELFGKEIESILAEGVYQFFHYHLQVSLTDCRIAISKNDFPDFTLLNQYAIDFKTSLSTQNPENDLGTLLSLPKKLKQFGDHIYYIFVRYTIKEDTIFIEDVFFDKFYHFVGKSKQGLLKYREKDGNIRPKKWHDFDNNIIYWDSYSAFVQTLQETSTFRSLQLIKKHFSHLDKEQKNEILQHLNKEI